MRSWLVMGLWLVGLFGCGLERIDFDPVRAPRDAGVDVGPPPPPADSLNQCRGGISVCNDLDEAACEARAECSFAQACVMRLSFRCSSLDSPQQCLQVPGCQWDDVLDACVGLPSPGHCERLAPASCAGAPACERVNSPRCYPKRGCVQVPPSECPSVPGCVSSCGASETLCGDRCADLQTSALHCGACGVFCPGRCEGGSCFAYGPCTTDAECAIFDDGDACTGIVQCVGGGCQRTPPTSCDDGVECTLDRCNPRTGACSYEPRDGFCSLLDRCDVTAGCVRGPSCTAGSCPSGEACVDVLGVAWCSPEGEGTAGTVCDSDLDCASGLECINRARDDFLGVCGTSCVDDTRCGGGVCVGGICSTPCSLLASDTTCSDSLRCQPYNSSGVTQCIDNRDAVGQGSPCTTHAQCERGLLCIRNSSGDAFCRSACDYDGGRRCPSSSLSCVNLEPPLVVNDRTFGACL